MDSKTVTLDVRDDIRNGQEPFSKIMNAVGTLRAGEQLLLIAPFEPVPLFRVLEKQGFQHTAHPTESGSWEVLFTRQADPQLVRHPAPVAPNGSNSCAGDWGEALEVDARGLEPPQPLVKILEALSTL